MGGSLAKPTCKKMPHPKCRGTKADKGIAYKDTGGMKAGRLRPCAVTQQQLCKKMILDYAESEEGPPMLPH